MTWVDGPDQASFAVLHIYPFFFVLGVLSSHGCALWLGMAVIFMMKDRRKLSGVDLAMAGISIFVFVALIVPWLALV